MDLNNISVWGQNYCEMLMHSVHDIVATGIIFIPGVSFPENFYDVASDNQMVGLNSAFNE